jgi:hypothetical protein
MMRTLRRVGEARKKKKKESVNGRRERESGNAVVDR